MSLSNAEVHKNSVFRSSQPCKLNRQICNINFCFIPAFLALNLANSRRLELTFANWNFALQLSLTGDHKFEWIDSVY